VSLRNGEKKKLAVAASVAAIGPELLLGTDAMSRFGLTLHWEDQLIPLPRKRPISRDWVLGAFIEIERNMRGPQRGTPTCSQCNQKGHLRMKCRVGNGTNQNLALSPPSSDPSDQEETPSESEGPDSPALPIPPPSPASASDSDDTMEYPQEDEGYEDELIALSPGSKPPSPLDE
jgi:hypothetical protein